MKGIRIILLGLFISGTSLVYSASSLGWGVTTFSRDTLPKGDTLFITTSLVNYSSQPFNDSVHFALKINGILNVNPNYFPNPFPNQPLSIPGNDSLPASLIIVITPAYYQTGPDILVVWPIVTNGSPPHDSIIKTIIVVDSIALGINDNSRKEVKAFYFNESIFIQSNSSEINLNRVRIFNLFGEEILNAPLNGNSSIPFNNRPNGIYFAEINFNSTEKRILKIVKY